VVAPTEDILCNGREQKWIEIAVLVGHLTHLTFPLPQQYRITDSGYEDSI
jgi:hypothetical protein